jgi:DNA replication protein DnaC
MPYSREVIEAANRQLALRRQKAQRERDIRRDALYAKFPRAEQIERQLSSTALHAARAVLKGGAVANELNKLREVNLALQRELTGILQQAGLAPDALDVRYACPLCNDEGYVDGKLCDCLKQLLRDEAYSRLNRLSPLSLSTFAAFSLDYYSMAPIREGGPSPRRRMGDILRFCQDYAANFSGRSPSLLMQGATGLGKTHLSLAIAQSVIDKGFGVIYGSTPNIVSQLEKERFGGRDSETESERYLQECDLLILDDLGTEFSTSFSSAAIYNLLNSRIMCSRPTIISTNLSMKELERCYSERLVSRVMGHHIRLEFLGRDVRQQKPRARG